MNMNVNLARRVPWGPKNWPSFKTRQENNQVSLTTSNCPLSNLSTYSLSISEFRISRPHLVKIFLFQPHAQWVKSILKGQFLNLHEVYMHHESMQVDLTETRRSCQSGFLKKSFDYECTSCQLKISSHQNLMGAMANPPNSDDSKC